MTEYILCLFIAFLNLIGANGHCIDIDSHVVSQGLHYVPGPNACSLCICDKGSPKWCQSVLCSPPQNCKSFQVGNTCCEFKCLDDILTNDRYKNTYDLALRLIASAVTAILSLSLLFFLFHRLRRRKIRLRHQNRQINDDQRSLNSIGYIAGSLGYLPGSLGYLGSGSHELEFHYEESSAHYSLWKPPGNYFPRGEAPPPYEEAVRSAQVESEAANNQIRISSCPQTISSNTITYSSHLSQGPTGQQQQNSCALLTRAENQESSCNNREYVNIPLVNTNVQQNSNKASVNVINLNVNNRGGHSLQECSRKNVDRMPSSSNKSKSFENIVSAKVEGATSSESRKPIVSEVKGVHKQNKYENIPAKSCHVLVDNSYRNSDRVKHLSIHKENDHYVNTRHRTIPSKDLTTVASRLSENLLKELDKVHSEATKSSTRPKDGTYHRTLPKNLREMCVPNSFTNHSHETNSKPEQDTTNHKSLPKHLKNYNYPVSITKSSVPEARIETAVKNTELPSSSFHPPPLVEPPKVEESQFKSILKSEDKSYNSYHSLSLSQDDDDYRSECENCKSSGLTNMDDEETDVLNETMTLQRRPLEPGEEVPYYRTSLTLPTNTRKPRILAVNPGRESWFLAMQQTSSSDESA